MTSAVVFQGARSLLESNVHRPATLEELLTLREHYPQAELLAGGTWIMRAQLRGESAPVDVIALAGVQEVHEITVDEALTLGAMVTLDRAAKATAGCPDLGALHDAATLAATPALRRMITIGGSLGAETFWASDIATAVLCLDADVIRERGVILGVRLTRSHRVSVHERFTWRSGGEYAVASVSASLDPATGDLRITVGSVEAQPRRWTSVEQGLAGESLDPGRAREVARRNINDIDPISAPGIPGSYRVAVLPEVVARAIGRLT